MAQEGGDDVLKIISFNLLSKSEYQKICAKVESMEVHDTYTVYATPTKSYKIRTEGTKYFQLSEPQTVKIKRLTGKQLELSIKTKKSGWMSTKHRK